MRIKHLLLGIFCLVVAPLGAVHGAPIDDVKVAIAKGDKVARKATRGPKKRRVKRVLEALEQYSYALRTLSSTELGESQPDEVKKVRGAIAELNGLDIVKEMKTEARTGFVLALEEERNEDAVALLERLLVIDARDAGVEQALVSLKEGLGKGSAP